MLIPNRPLVALQHGPALPPFERYESPHANLVLCKAQEQVRATLREVIATSRLMIGC